MSQMTAEEIKLLFTSCSLDVVHLDQGQLPKNGTKYVSMRDVLVVDSTNDRRMLLSSIRKSMKNHLRKIKNKTRQAYTYGGSFFTNPDGKFCLSVSVGVALKD